MADQIFPQTQTAELYGPQCGYNLRAIESHRCPECGLEIDRSKLGESILPWLHRKKLGYYRSFWKTVHLLTFHPRKLAQEMNCPARFADATKFRRLVVLHTWLTLAAALLISFVVPSDGLRWNNVWLSTDRLGSALQISLALFWLLCLWWYLLALSGLASYFFHPKSLDVIRQNRAIALSYYTCAPAAYLFLTIGICAAAMLATTTDWFDYLPVHGKALVMLIGFAPIILQSGAMLLAPLVVLRRATHCGSGGQALLAVFLIFGALVLGAILLVVLPLAAVGIALMILSFRL